MAGTRWSARAGQISSARSSSLNRTGPRVIPLEMARQRSAVCVACRMQDEGACNEYEETYLVCYSLLSTGEGCTCHTHQRNCCSSCSTRLSRDRAYHDAQLSIGYCAARVLWTNDTLRATRWCRYCTGMELYHS